MTTPPAHRQQRDSVIAYVVTGGLSTARATANVDRLIAEVQAAAWDEAADAVEAQTCTCGCRRSAPLLRAMAAAARPDDTKDA